MSEHIREIPDELPVMILPNSVLFPQALLPLHLFEERYRKMLSYCLDRERMFCIGLLKPGRQEALFDDDFYRIGCAGLIRACVRGSDGTAHLVLQGVGRVRFVETMDDHPFRTARLEVLPSTCEPSVEIDALRRKVVELCTQLRQGGMEVSAQFQSCLPKLCNCETVADVVASTLIDDLHLRQQLLEEPSVSNRLRTIILVLSRKLSAS